jgi:hypothetical protein
MEFCMVDATQLNRRRLLRQTDAFRGEMESDRLRRLLDMTDGLNSLRLLDKDERLLIVSSLREQMSNLEGNLAFKAVDLAQQPSPTNQSPRSRLLDADPTLISGEFTYCEDDDLETLFRENSLSVNVTAAAPQDIDLMYVAPLISSHENKDRIIGSRASTALAPKNRTYIMLDNFLRRSM